MKTLRTLRTRRGWTQEQLAAKAGITRGCISHLEVGLRSNPSIAILRRLAKALGVRPGRLLE